MALTMRNLLKGIAESSPAWANAIVQGRTYRDQRDDVEIEQGFREREVGLKELESPSSIRRSESIADYYKGRAEIETKDSKFQEEETIKLRDAYDTWVKDTKRLSTVTSDPNAKSEDIRTQLKKQKESADFVISLGGKASSQLREIDRTKLEIMQSITSFTGPLYLMADESVEDLSFDMNKFLDSPHPDIGSIFDSLEKISFKDPKAGQITSDARSEFLKLIRAKQEATKDFIGDAKKRAPGSPTELVELARTGKMPVEYEELLKRPGWGWWKSKDPKEVESIAAKMYNEMMSGILIEANTWAGTLFDGLLAHHLEFIESLQPGVDRGGVPTTGTPDFRPALPGGSPPGLPGVAPFQPSTSGGGTFQKIIGGLERGVRGAYDADWQLPKGEREREVLRRLSQ